MGRQEIWDLPLHGFLFHLVLRVEPRALLCVLSTCPTTELYPQLQVPGFESSLGLFEEELVMAGFSEFSLPPLSFRYAFLMPFPEAWRGKILTPSTSKERLMALKRTKVLTLKRLMIQ